MERRRFLKAGVLTAFGLCGFSKKNLCADGKAIASIGHNGSELHQYSGVFSGVLANEWVTMPDAFSHRLTQEKFAIFVPEKNDPVMLIPEKSAEWEAFEKFFAAADSAGFPILREQALVDKSGQLHLPKRISVFAGITTSIVIVAGRGNRVEIIDSAAYHISIT